MHCRTTTFMSVMLCERYDLTLFSLLEEFFFVMVFALLANTRSNSTNPELTLVLNIHFLCYILACPRICSGKENQSENEVIAHFLSLYCCLLICAIPPVELNPHLQFQPFFFLLLTHYSNLFSCIYFFLCNRMQIFIPRESEKT